MARLLFLPILFFSSLFIQAQDTIAIQSRRVSNSRFVDFYPGKGSELAALAADGSVYKIDLETLKATGLGKIKALTIGCDREGDIWAADSLGYIQKWKDTGWVSNRLVTGRVWKFVFNKANELFLLTDLGIYDSRDDMYYGTNKLLFNLRHNLNPDVYFIDEEDAIWIVYRIRGFGTMLRYSTRDKIYYTNNHMRSMDFRLRAFVPGGSVNFLIKSDEYGMSTIKTFDVNGSDSVYQNEFDPYRGPTRDQEEYLGPGWFDKERQEMYYYSSRGVSRAKYDSSNKRLLTPERLFPAQNDWINRVPDKSYFAFSLKSFYQWKSISVYLHDRYGLFIYKNGVIQNWN